MFCFWFRPGVPAVMPMDLSFHFLLLSIPPEPAQTSSFFLFLPSLHQKPHLIRHVRLCWNRILAQFKPGTIRHHGLVKFFTPQPPWASAPLT